MQSDLNSIAIAQLDAIDGDDPESAHAEAEEIVLLLLPEEVQAAFKRVVDRCKWWAYA